jgi:hypothetical protein
MIKDHIPHKPHERDPGVQARAQLGAASHPLFGKGQWCETIAAVDHNRGSLRQPHRMLRAAYMPSMSSRMIEDLSRSTILMLGIG